MRREGFELCVSPPKIVVGEDGQEPIEEVFVDVDQEYVGTIINMLTGSRKGVIVDQAEDLETGRCTLTFHVYYILRGEWFGPTLYTLTYWYQSNTLIYLYI